MRTRVGAAFGIDYPIFAFSHCRDVVAAVSRAGGLGVLGALYFTPEELDAELTWIDEHVEGKPYGVDVVMPASYTGAELASNGGRGDFEAKLEELIPARHREFVEQTLERFGVPPASTESRHLLGWTDATARPQVEVALAHPIALLANALGPPPADIVALAHDHGVKVAALASNARHATKQVAVGVDLIVAQGTEAGGHTGDIATMVLVPEVVEAVGPVPVLAAGGIGRGSQVAAALALGADGVWTGSVWLTVAEADSSPILRKKLLAASSADTVRSRSLTGKPARMLRTAWTDAWESPDSPGTLPMPLQFMLTADAIGRISRAENPELVGLPVGQIVGAMKSVRPARDVIYTLIEEYIAAVERLNEISGGTAEADNRAAGELSG
jgi:NAD(P)H-dependent flavin oxidoreductase YrpB (nitropropane dioxygenase family)